MIVTTNASLLAEHFADTRNQTEKICAPLRTEDYVAQPIVDVSPPKWHLAHTTWFFEEFILHKYMKGYKPFHPEYAFLFNSYYISMGERWQRPMRGNLTRPGVEEIYQFRKYVDEHMMEFLENGCSKEVEGLLLIGINHEQQHQELLMTDIKYILGSYPLFPAYDDSIRIPKADDPGELRFDISDEGVYPIGFEGEGFCYDNELAAHQVFLHKFGLANRLITKGEYLDFMRDGGYSQHHLWLSDAWDWINENEVTFPLYWHNIDGAWHEYTLAGLKPVDENAPMTHVSLYEADAYAHWAGLRLPTEFEWETSCRKLHKSATNQDNFVDRGILHPYQTSQLHDMLGNTWEWTNSAYLPYPRYKKAPGAIGEYNGKFMMNQMVLRGGSCATPQNHIRISYRNFFHPYLRWQFTGIRLAKDIE
ncbi:MAG TPA: ergothioneine biosynthesis protein EgtB [Cytophagales bacterium]|jgi:ergothioneine biosynthesis protein EgtB|nr:ergothioneine biosynthesis protein EgtB [Cytophagales bacterium]